ncbi:DNA polymerase III subunit delta' [Hydrogenimonas sp. SS33]|uniref:DNA polymerase III subunit delta' n=1 Tax=Hydrogenimonas leucolamina TaxID=2954236 RepID=UPI00336BF55C
MAEPASRIVLTDRFEETSAEFRQRWEGALFHTVEADEFLIEHAKEATEKAWLTSDREKVIVLAAKRFSPIAQNKLLKIIEEPPSKTHFLLLTPSKASLLPTVRSRMVIENRLQKGGGEESGVDLERFDLARLFDLLQENRRTDARSASELVQALAKEAMRSDRYLLDEKLLQSFEESVRLLDMGSPPAFVLSRLGLKLLGRRR